MEGIGQVVIKPDALQVVTRDANRLWTRLQKKDVRSKKSSDQSKFYWILFLKIQRK